MFRKSLIGLSVLVASAVTTAQQLETRVTSTTPMLVPDRVIVRVTDLAKSIAFYRDLVGLPLQSTYEEFAVLGGDKMTVMLQQVARKSTEPSSGLASLTEVVLQSTDVFASYQSLKSRGVVFRLEPRLATTDGVRDLYTADFRDPDGHILSIAGWVVHHEDTKTRRHE
jgi:catechol 2,3-dioxygenase-like lactoylglutathione lyase family enzyme